MLSCHFFSFLYVGLISSLITFNKSSTPSPVQIKEPTLIFLFFFGFSPDCDKLILLNAKETKKERSNEFAAKFAHVIGFCACSIDNIYRGVLDTRLTLDTCGRPNPIRVRCVWMRPKTIDNGLTLSSLWGGGGRIPPPPPKGSLE